MQSILDKYKKMKKIWLIILWLFMLSFSWNITRANNEYEYKNLDITANVLNDWTIDVIESFTADFFVNKHWIIRSIPLNYNVWWKDFHIEISDINVQWKNFTTNQYDWNIEIKIWDADVTLIWEQDYPISYSTYGLIRNFSWMGYAELYWNLVGYDFDTNINKIKAEIILPKPYTWLTSGDFLITTDWESKTIDWFDWTVDWSRWDRIIITYDKWLQAYHWITLTVIFPNNYFEFDHDRQEKLIGYEWKGSIISLILTWLILLTPFLAFIVTTIKIIKYILKQRKWVSEKRKIRKEYLKKYPVFVQYNPPKWLNSAEVWLLLKRRVWTKDLLSLIYKWAADWYIKIDNSNSDLFLVKIKELPWDSQNYENILFNKLFVKNKINVNKPSNYLYRVIESVSKSLEKHWISVWWFSEINDSNHKTNDHKTNIWCFNLLLFFSSLLTMFIIPACPVIYFVLAVIYVVISDKWYSFETDEWAKLISHILWYKKFLKTCDEDKLKTSLQEDPLYFDKILPYAIVFWIETKLIKKMKNIMQELDIEPTRYDWDISKIPYTASIISSNLNHSPSNNSSSYNSSGWFSSWSSFSSGWSSFSSWGGWGWWGWSSW